MPPTPKYLKYYPPRGGKKSITWADILDPESVAISWDQIVDPPDLEGSSLWEANLLTSSLNPKDVEGAPQHVNLKDGASYRINGEGIIQRDTVRSNFYLDRHTNPISGRTGFANLAAGFNAGNNLLGSYNTLLGMEAGHDMVNGNNNIIIGRYAGGSSAGSQNVLVGNQAGRYITSSQAVIIGDAAGSMGALTQGTILIGSQAGKSLTGGESNVMMGYAAGYTLNSGSYNTAIGHMALYSAARGSRNTMIGYQAGKLATNHDNTGIGYNVFAAMTTGQENTALGSAALASITTGAYNTAIGFNALNALTWGTENTAVGYQAGMSIVGTYNNSLFGYYAGRAITSGIGNTLLGYTAGRLISTGGKNTIVGQRAGFSLMTGGQNVLMGDDTGENLSTGNKVIFLGSNAGRYETDSNVLLISNHSRGNKTDDRAAAILFGLMDTSNSANQELRVNAKFYLPLYGSGSITGTATKMLAVDANGKVIEVSLPEASTNYWQRNATKLSPATAGDNLEVVSNASNGAIRGQSTSYDAIYGQSAGANAGISAVFGYSSGKANGLRGSSSTGYGLLASSATGVGANISAGNNVAIEVANSSPTSAVAKFIGDSASTDGITPMVYYQRATTGTASQGIGVSSNYFIENAAGDVENSIEVQGYLSDVTDGAEKSAYAIKLRTGAIMARKLLLEHTGKLTLHGYGAGNLSSQAHLSTYLMATLWDGTIVERFPNLKRSTTVDSGAFYLEASPQIEIVYASTSTGNAFVVLPMAADVPYLTYKVKRIDNTANTVSIIPQAPDVIEGSLSVLGVATLQTITLHSDGTSWWIIDSHS